MSKEHYYDIIKSPVISEKATLTPFDPATAEAADATGAKSRSVITAAPAPRRKPTPAPSAEP